jgi:hypothetical protein
VLTVAVFLLDVRLVFQPENVQIAHGKNVAASIGFQCNTRVSKTLGLNEPKG